MAKKADQNVLIYKIEYVALSIIEQLLMPRVPSKLLLRTSDLEWDPILNYTPRLSSKLAHDIYAIHQVYKLIKSGQFSTKRSLFYDNKNLYVTQAKLDRSITNVCNLLNCERFLLNVLSCSKGVIRGALTLLPSTGSLIDCREQGVLISEALTECRPIPAADFILVVEKDSVFQKLNDDNFFEFFPNSILVTGRGYPDICTRYFLRWLVNQAQIPIYGLFDGDPHGIEIYLTYKYGGCSEKAEGKGAFVSSIEWIGIKPSEVLKLAVEQQHWLRMLSRDYNKITRVRRRAASLGENEIVAELEILRNNRHKFEIEAISSIGHTFLTKFFIQPKVKTKRSRL